MNMKTEYVIAVLHLKGCLNEDIINCIKLCTYPDSINTFFHDTALEFHPHGRLTKKQFKEYSQ